MFRASRAVAVLAMIVLFAVPGCTALQQIATLRTVAFAFAGVSDVRVAGIRVGAGSSFGALSIAEAARLGAAVATKQVPLELVAHVSATNPAANSVAARMVGLGWTLFIEDRQALSGELASAVTITPGQSVDVPLTVRLNLLELTSGGARDLFDMALAVAGQGAVQKDMRLELVPTIETSLGPIRYPFPVTVRRATAAR